MMLRGLETEGCQSEQMVFVGSEPVRLWGEG